MAQVLIGLGSNLGDRQQLLSGAVDRLAATPGVQSVHVSRWRETNPVGGPSGQPQFLNGAALVVVSLSPQELFSRLQEIELELGRTRLVPSAPRTVDLDLLLYDERIIDSSSLKVPHSRMAFRKFVVEPAAEIAGAMMHPIINWTIKRLAEHLNTALPYVAISGSSFSSARRLAANVADRLGWRFLNLPADFDELANGNSPSLTPVSAIEFLRTKAQMVSRELWPNDLRGVVSSFWIEDLKAIARRVAPEMIDSRLMTAIDNVVPPKLLVRLARRGGSFSTKLAPRGIGPVLELTDENPAVAQAELTAAIDAMR